VKVQWCPTNKQLCPYPATIIASRPRVPRNDLLPTLHLQNIPIKDLKMPARTARKLDPSADLSISCRP
jgi:hypothetical protein